MELPAVVNLALFGAIALLNIISLGLLAYVVNSWSGNYSFIRIDSPSSANFMLFNTIWTFLVLIYVAVIPRVFAKAFHSLVALVLLAITTIFWFAGSIALAAYLGAHTCSGGGWCSVYKAAQAATAFGFFIWVMFTVLLVFEALGFLRHGMKGRANADGTQMTSQTGPHTYPGA